MSVTTDIQDLSFSLTTTAYLQHIPITSPDFQIHYSEAEEKMETPAPRIPAHGVGSSRGSVRCFISPGAPGCRRGQSSSGQTKVCGNELVLVAFGRRAAVRARGGALGAVSVPGDADRLLSASSPECALTFSIRACSVRRLCLQQPAGTTGTGTLSGAQEPHCCSGSLTVATCEVPLGALQEPNRALNTNEQLPVLPLDI